MKGVMAKRSVIVAFISLMVLAACSSPLSFEGTSLDPPESAPGFTLHNQLGDVVSLSDFTGKIIVLTFLYTNCPDICPLTTEALHRAYDELDDETLKKIDFVAISVDPERDTVEQAYRYSKEKDMLNKWHFLVGTEGELAPVWADYYVGPIPIHVDGNEDGHQEDAKSLPTSATSVENLQSAIKAKYNVSHQAPVYLIDQRGTRRVVITSLLLDPAPLVHDIRQLLD